MLPRQRRQKCLLAFLMPDRLDILQEHIITAVALHLGVFQGIIFFLREALNTTSPKLIQKLKLNTASPKLKLIPFTETQTDSETQLYISEKDAISSLEQICRNYI